MGKAWKQTVTTYFSLDVVNQVMHLLDARVARVAEQHGVEYRNLRSAPAARLEEYYDYLHYTPAGGGSAARRCCCLAHGSSLPPLRQTAVDRLERAGSQAVFRVAEEAERRDQVHGRDRQRCVEDVLNEEPGSGTLRSRLGDHRLGHVHREARLGDAVQQLRDPARSTGEVQ